MAEGSQEKTEEATPKRLKEARNRGEVARSQDLDNALMLALALGVLAAGLTQTVHRADEALRATISRANEVHRGAFGETELLASLRIGFAAGEAAVVPLLLATVIGALAFGFAQIGALLTAEPLKPQLKRMDPIAGIKRLFFGLDPLVELLKALVKMAIVGTLTWRVLDSWLGVLLTMGRVTPVEGARLLGQVVLELALWVMIGMAALGLLDFFYQRYRHSKEMRMSKEEIKEEYKGQEGDPQHKSRRRRAHKEVLEHSMVRQVEKAHMVVTNPTHIACALRYDPEEEGAPRLLAKGQGYLAQRIIDMARELRIPVIRNIGLARALHELEFDEEIPEELYEGASVVLRYLQDLAHSEGRLMPWESAEGEDETGEESGPEES